jgi:hypothetical protein
MRPGQIEKDFAVALEKTKAESQVRNNGLAKLASDMGVDLKDSVRFESNLLAVATDEDIKLLREKAHVITHPDIIQQSHPDTIVVCDAPGIGGVIENLNEQHAAIMDSITRTPTGFGYMGLRGLMEDFERAAATLETNGLIKEAEELTTIAEEVFSEISALKKKVLSKSAAPPPKGVPSPEVPNLSGVADDTIPNAPAPSSEGIVSTVGRVGAEVAIGAAIQSALTKAWNVVKSFKTNITPSTAITAEYILESSTKSSKLMNLAKSIKNPKVRAVIAIIITTAAIAEAFTMSKIEVLGTDLNDLLEKLNSLAEDDYGDLANKAVKDMILEANKLKTLQASTIKEMPADQILSTIKEMEKANNLIKGNLGVFKANATGLISAVIGFPKLTSLVNDIDASFKTFNAAYLQKINAKDTELYNQIIAAQKESHDTDMEKSEKKVVPSDSERIKGIQTFLHRHYPEVVVSGAIDDATTKAVEDFADTIALELDVPQQTLSANRILTEGTKEMLQDFYDMYRNRDDIINRQMGLNR